MPKPMQLKKFASDRAVRIQDCLLMAIMKVVCLTQHCLDLLSITLSCCAQHVDKLLAVVVTSKTTNSRTMPVVQQDQMSTRIPVFQCTHTLATNKDNQ